MNIPHAAPALGTYNRRSSDSGSSRTRRLSSSGAPQSGSNPKQAVRGAEVHDAEKANDTASSSAQTSEEQSPQSATGEKAGTGAADPKLVTWDGPDDPANPQNWSTFKKWQVIIVASTCSLCVTNNSSIVASNYEPIEADFGISRTVAILGLSLFVTGLGIGPVSGTCKRRWTGKRGSHLTRPPVPLAALPGSLLRSVWQAAHLPSQLCSLYPLPITCRLRQSVSRVDRSLCLPGIVYGAILLTLDTFPIVVLRYSLSSASSLVWQVPPSCRWQEAPLLTCSTHTTSSRPW